MKIISVVGARPNFMKVAPIVRAIAQLKIQNSKFKIDTTTLQSAEGKLQSSVNNRQKEDQDRDSGSESGMTTDNRLSTINHLICHTGQHYDEKMSKVFFDELELPKPDFYLGVGGGSHAEQTAKIMIEFEKVLIEEKPDLVIVVGDVNSTIACSLTAVKLGIKVAHVEAGLRSFDRGMPEEINRILTDSISDYLFVTEPSGMVNLKNEGIDGSKVFYVGHVMIDSLAYYLPKIEKRETRDVRSEKTDEMSDVKSQKTLQYFDKLSMTEEERINSHQSSVRNHSTNHLLPTTNYILVTMHRPSNVDFKAKLEELLKMLNRLAEKRKVIFPIHPRTKNNISKFGLNTEYSNNLIITEPIGYLDFIGLVKNAEVILTDSGGIQEESTYLGVQCVTLRNSTERPITVDIGTNHLVGDDFNEAERVVNEILAGKKKAGKIPELWDGKAAERIVQIIVGSPQ